MTLTEITMRKFIADIQNQNSPDELKDLFQKLKIKAIASNKPMITLTTLTIFRQIFSISEVTRIINHYRHKPLVKQTTLKL